jgi:release factor glutamine methyltransferase
VTSLVEILTRTEIWFRQRGIPSPRLEAELLLCTVLGVERIQLYLLHDRPMSEEELGRLRPMVARRGKREPLAWIMGEAGFHTLDLKVLSGVLVPRPDTEALVNAGLEWIPEGDEPVYVADVGCGTGAIGLALAAVRPSVRVYAIDRSEEALSNTRLNVAALALSDRVAVLAGDLLSPIPNHRPVDWVFSNPPYIPKGQIDGLQPEVSRWEPRGALDGGPDGLEVYRRLVPLAAQRARRGVLVEVGAGQAGLVLDMFRRAGLVNLTTWPDLAGVDRVVGGRKPSAD